MQQKQSRYGFLVGVYLPKEFSHKVSPDGALNKSDDNFIDVYFIRDNNYLQAAV